MSSTADRIRENALRARQQAAQPDDQQGQDPIQLPDAQPAKQSTKRKTPAPEVKATTRTTGGSHAPRLRRVRKNVDLSPDLNRRLGDWQRDTATELGLARVTAQEVLTELVNELLDDAALATRVRDRIYRSVNQ